MKKNPLVSVIIPTFNRAELLSRSIRSVLNQSYTSLECIVVDDASTDKSKEVIDKFTDKRLVYIKHKVNKNASAPGQVQLAAM